MNPFYPSAALSWIVFWAFPGFIFRTIPTNTLLAFFILAILMFAVARPVSNNYAQKHPSLAQGLPRYKEILKGVGIIFLASVFFQFVHYGFTHG